MDSSGGLGMFIKIVSNTKWFLPIYWKTLFIRVRSHFCHMLFVLCH